VTTYTKLESDSRRLLGKEIENGLFLTVIEVKSLTGEQEGKPMDSIPFTSEGKK
jgi:hypothetical protein